MDILKAFEKTFADTLDDPNIHERIQKVKDALFRRSYIEAFASNDNLEAYVARWSPSRALAYHSILNSKPSTKKLLDGSRINCLCIGGGAGAEIAALSQFKSHIQKVVTIDIGDWAPVVKPLAINLGFMDLEMINGDALDIAPTLDLTQFGLITCLFTTNELVLQSKQKFIKLFQSFAVCKPGTLIVVIESAGSYSEVVIGKKTFPVYYLLHFALASKDPKDPKTSKSRPLWELVDSTDSEWYRLAPELTYPLELQNMRYFLRVYRRTQTPYSPPK